MEDGNMKTKEQKELEMKEAEVQAKLDAEAKVKAEADAKAAAEPAEPDAEQKEFLQWKANKADIENTIPNPIKTEKSRKA